MTSPHDFWPDSGLASLARSERGWLLPTDAFLRHLLARPELALVEESCGAEIALHELLRATPARTVSAYQLAALQDADARENYTVFLRFRDGLLAAGTLEAYYLQLMRSGAVNIPAVFIDTVVQALLQADTQSAT